MRLSQKFLRNINKIRMADKKETFKVKLKSGLRTEEFFVYKHESQPNAYVGMEDEIIYHLNELTFL
jgi:hypothetical protein